MNKNDFDTVSTPTDVLAESLSELDALCAEPTAQDPVVPQLDDAVVKASAAPVAEEGEKGVKTRKPRSGVGAADLRQSALQGNIVELFKGDPAPKGCSETVRKLEALGVTSPTLWVDTYAVLNTSGEFEPGPTLGKRVKFVLKQNVVVTLAA